MATMKETIEYIDRVKPNAWEEQDKYRWLMQVEGMIATEVHQEEAPDYDLPDDAETPLLVPAPYDDLYGLYLACMIDLWNREINNYNNSAMVFAQRLEQYKAWYIQRYRVCRARNFRNVMG